ncbi:hypothetical protein G7068_10665 [Leucobacter viscericola]|uniref:Uncharacterized protein n=1 Tax=Leucobacter viscericola TaxID=2714935 RepID=A0A6G7XGB8_9MICO|nr:hypothetical protein [Leucobacter viscericola]QIK63605.1 hypothetical protein G7068_10665 [Leucobacter viscericola]
MNPFRLTSRVQAAPRVSPQAQVPASEAVAVPWQVVTRSRSGVIEVEHCGSTPLHSVRFALAGKGMLGLSLPRTVYPGQRVRVVLRGSHAEGTMEAADAMLMMRWFQVDGTEMLWPIAL